MKKGFFLLLLLTGVCGVFSQGLHIKFTNDLKGDTVVISAYNSNTERFETIHQYPLNSEMVLHTPEPLQPNIYIVGIDSLMLFEFFISETKKQQFEISFLDNKVSFKKSKENSTNQELLQLHRQCEMALKEIDDRFKEVQMMELPKDSVQPIIDSIIIAAEKMMDKKDSITLSFIKKYDGTLFSSVIASSKEVARPPKEIYTHRNKYLMYFCSHLYDNFAWHDERLLQTVIPNHKHRAFVESTFKISPDTALVFVAQAVKNSMVNENMFYYFLDYLTKHIGSFTSRYHDETLYIAALKEALTYPELAPARKAQYEYQLSILDKNHAGDLAPNFNLMMSNNDTLELYDIEAEHMILYFQNPDCPTCAELLATMETMPTLQKAVKEGKLKMLTVFFEENETYWQKYLQNKANPKYLHGWNYDLSIEKNNLYNTHFIPMLMLLDKDKKIIKKDILSNEIEWWLMQLGL